MVDQLRQNAKPARVDRYGDSPTPELFEDVPF